MGRTPAPPAVPPRAQRPQKGRESDPDLLSRAAEAVEGGEPVGSVRLLDLARSGTKAVMRRETLRGAARFTREAAKVTIGRSQIAPRRGDWRFRDATWSQNAVYRRLMQLYLAWSSELERGVEDVDLDWQDAERAKFIATVLSSALAPTNTVLGNPEAIKRALETGGTSLVRGAHNFIGDVRHNGGMPSIVDTRPFVVGETLAATPGAVVHRDEVFELIQYRPTTPEVRSRPVLMVPPQINKYYFMDLAPGRSFVEHAVSRGIPFFVMSWRNPSAEQAGWDLDTYAAAVLRALDAVQDIARSDDVNLLSLCAGGILTAAVLSHLAQTGDDRVHTASFGVTLLDFEEPAPLGMFDSPPVLSLARFRSKRAGVLDGKALAAVFTWMRPNDLIWNYWVNNYLLGKDPPAFDILAWNVDSTNLPTNLHRQFLRIFSENALATPGALNVLGTPVDLGRIEVESYVTGATTDHLTPWKGCFRTTDLLRGDSTFILSNAGHIASLVNPPGNPRAHYFAGPQPDGDPEAWMAAAERQQGTWWDHWADWVTARSGEERRAPKTLGSRRHRVIEPAPGAYVRDLSPAAA